MGGAPGPFNTPARSTVSTTSPLWRVRAAAENSTMGVPLIDRPT